MGYLHYVDMFHTLNNSQSFLIRDSGLLLTAPTVLGAWTVTGWSKRTRLQKVSQLDLEIKLSGKVADQTALIIIDGSCCKLLSVMLELTTHL